MSQAQDIKNAEDGGIHHDQDAAFWLRQFFEFVSGLIIPSRPAIEAGTIYTRQQVQRNLGVCHETVTLWIDRGLPVTQPGTKAMFFLGNDLLEFIQGYTPQPKPKTYAEKQSVRAGRPKKAGKVS